VAALLKWLCASSPGSPRSRCLFGKLLSSDMWPVDCRSNATPLVPNNGLWCRPSSACGLALST
jgi:hypothetical protein